MTRFVRFFSLVFAFALVVNANAQDIFVEDFESMALPTGWTLSQDPNSVGWEFGNASALGSDFFNIDGSNATGMAASNDDKHDDNTATANVADKDLLITPAIDLTPYAGAGVFLSIDYFNTGEYGSEATVESYDGTTGTVIQMLEPGGAWQTAIIDLSAYTSMSDFQLAFRHNDNGQWADGFALDNVRIYLPPENDLMLNELDLDRFSTMADVGAITGTVFNQGSNEVTSFDVTYTIDGGAPQTDNITGVSIPPATSYTFTHAVAPAVVSGNEHIIDVAVATVNGQADANPADNQTSAKTSIISTVPSKNPILADLTGAWCQFCPDGTVVMEDILANDPSVIGIAIHNGDAMDVAEGVTLAQAFTSSYPSGAVDFKYFDGEEQVGVNRGSWASRIAARKQTPSPVSVGITDVVWDAASRQIVTTISADFFTTTTDVEFRINLLVIEDSVVGSGTGYDQVNYYNTVNGHPYFGAGNPIEGFVHNHTLRAVVGGSWGITGPFSSAIANNDSYSQVFPYTLPAEYNENHIKLVAIVTMFGASERDREIFNGAEASLVGFTPVTDIEDELAASFSTVYPNPFSNHLAIEFALPKTGHTSISVMDIYGKEVARLAEGTMSSGAHTIKWNGKSGSNELANGIYIIRIVTNGVVSQKKVILSR